MLKKLLFTNTLSMGDIVLLTAAVRDLHRAYPGVFATDVRTSFQELWAGNPWLTPLDEYDPEVTVVPCSLPLVQRSNEAGVHALHGFIDFLNRYLGTRIRLTELKGDIHLSAAERRAPPLVHELAGRPIPYWLLNAGGTTAYTTKWWDPRRYQEVVDLFRGRLAVVQVGAAQDPHPQLEGVIDLRGRTSVRQLVQLVHHAQGVLCGVTGLMHLAAAVPLPGREHRLRPAVVVAGGREPPTWEAYPGHQFLHTIGALPCCAAGGCWRARIRPLGDGHPLDRPERICCDVRDGWPHCLQLITPAEVARRIEGYFAGGQLAWLTPPEARAARRAIEASAAQRPRARPLTVETASAAAEEFIKKIPAYPGCFRGRGVVICAGGVRGFTNAWVCLHMLRRTGCTLPVELWHLGEEELDAPMAALVAPLGVSCVDATRVQREHPARLPHPWALKPYALLHCSFRQVLLLDMDNMPVRNPAFLFETPQFRRTGALFWPDYGRLGPERSIWRACGVPYRAEPEFESGQIVVDKARVWEPLQLALWYNEHAAFFYQHAYGDKETFHMAFRKLGRPYAMPAKPVARLTGTMCQHDFQGRRLFQHRNGDKWNLFLRNRRVRGFLFEAGCRAAVRQLRARWDGRLSRYAPAAAQPAAPAGLSAQAAPATIHACMSSCPAREAMRQQTLLRLRQTDWGERPLQVLLDPGRFAHPEDNIAYNGWRALRAGLDSGAEFILYLEDDLRFNRHLFHNLQAWAPLRRRQLTLATLYNPALRELACDVAHQAIVVDPRAFFGSQAVLLSRRAAEFVVHHWKEEPLALDLRLARLAARLGQPLLAHCPSLVQHVGARSFRGGGFHQAPDFDARWRAPDRPTEDHG